MKKILLILSFSIFSSCGYSSRQNEASGQIKKVKQQTPLICPNYIEADISLGVMRDGVGSMSTHDIKVTIEDLSQLTLLKRATETGKIVKIEFDEVRVTFCVPNYVLRKVEIVE